MTEPQDRIALSAPKGIVALLLSLVVGGGIGATATGFSMGRTEPAASMPWLTRPEVEAVAVHAAEAAAAQAREDCRRDLAMNTASVSASLTRIESAVTKLAADTEQLKVAFAGLSAKGSK